MKKKFIYLLGFSVLLVAAFYSCRREYSFENGQISSGFLLRDLNDDCQPIHVEGNFIENKNLSDSNFIDVNVSVTGPGSYLIQTNTVNGYSFKATGNFNNAGTATVRLQSTGKPIQSGTDLFTVNYDSSSCDFFVHVQSNNTSNGQASYILLGDPGPCSNTIVFGDYISNVAVDTSNKVTINVRVTVPGIYLISTNLVNGYKFSNSGTFTDTGVHNITLLAIGTPLNTGTDLFSVQGSGSSCTIPVSVVRPITVSNNDYFPLTKASFWVYDHSEYPSDSLKRFVNDTITKAGNQYMTVWETIPFSGIDELYFRKAGLQYYEYAKADKYTVSFTYAPQLYGDILFLKEGLSTGDVWYSQEFTGTASFGQTLLLRYQFTCVNANAGATINGKVFANVYKIKMLPQIRSLLADYGNTGEVYDYYYARGVGLIYVKKVQNQFFKYELKLRRWLVN